jgi:hypothetical protein
MGRNLLLGALFPFITAELLHVRLTRCFKARGTFEAAFRMNAYAAAVNLLSWFPVVGMVLEFYRLYVMTVGPSAVFITEAWKALLSLVLIVALYVALASSMAPFLGTAPLASCEFDGSRRRWRPPVLTIGPGQSAVFDWMGDTTRTVEYPKRHFNERLFKRNGFVTNSA